MGPPFGGPVGLVYFSAVYKLVSEVIHCIPPPRHSFPFVGAMDHGRRVHGVRKRRAKVAPAEAYSLEDVVDPITEELWGLLFIFSFVGPPLGRPTQSMRDRALRDPPGVDLSASAWQGRVLHP